MAKPKQTWTSNEINALTEGVKHYGEGKWKAILDDPMYSSALSNRSNVALKDKWRNMSGSEKRPTRRMAERTSRRSSKKRKPRAPSYTEMIIEALSAFEDPNGTAIDSMDSYLRGKYKVPKNLGRVLPGKVVRLALSGKIEKVHERYKLKGGETSWARDDAMAIIIDNRNNEQAGPQNRIDFYQDLNEEPVEQAGPQNRVDFYQDLNEEPVEQVGPQNRIDFYQDLNEEPVEQAGPQNRVDFHQDLNEEPVEQAGPLDFNLNEEPVEPLQQKH